MQKQYTLQVELDEAANEQVAVTLYAANKQGFLTGLMNCNKMSEYIEEKLIAEESTDPLVMSKQEAKWLIFSVLEDWESWSAFIKQDLEGQDLG